MPAGEWFRLVDNATVVLALAFVIVVVPLLLSMWTAGLCTWPRLLRWLDGGPWRS